MSLGLRDVGLVTELVRGLGVTLRHLFKPTVTIQYPTERREPYPRFRGLIRWEREKCAACVICEHYCPARAIQITTGEDASGNKVILDWRLDASHCMVCGLCVEVCPVGALSHSHYFELAVYERAEMVFANERMAGEPPITRYR